MIYQIQADSNEINTKNVIDWLTAFDTIIKPKRIELGAYYDGLNQIVKQGAVKDRPNYSINVNMAKYITDVVTGYTFGKPITYATNNQGITATMDLIDHINKSCKVDEIDFNVAGDMSAYGIGYQMVLVKEGLEPIEDRIVLKRLEPEHTFFVTDNTILRNPLCAVYYYNYWENKQPKTRVYVYDKENLYIFDGYDTNVMLTSTEPHNMGYIPILQCLNNDDAFGDYQQITGLLDALSLAISNNTDNLQSIANAILAVSGGTLSKEQLDLINQEKTMNLPVGAKAEWIIKNINPEAEKMQLENLLDFIFQISQVPDLTDDAFGGNQSGVAMQFKLWGIDQLWATKVRKYTQTIYDRLKIFLHLLQYKVTTQVELSNDIELTFYKNLPSGKSDEYAMVQALKGVVSDKTLLSNISIVKDVDAELEQIKTEREEEADSYGFNNNGALNNDEQ